MARYSRQAVFTDRFHESLADVWRELFSSPIHLDAVLSQTPRDLKSYLAAFLPVLLRRPVALARALRSESLASPEVWNLSPEELVDWRGVEELGQKFIQLCGDVPEVGPPLGPSSQAIKVLRRSAELSSRDDFPFSWQEAWAEEWGENQAEVLCRSLASDPPLSLRASRRIGQKRLLAALGDQVDLPEGSRADTHVPSGVVLSDYVPVLGTSLAKDGLFEIQDLGSQCMAHFALWPERFSELLTASPGVELPTSSFEGDLKAGAPIVVDACAGAGGKSLALSDLMDGRGRVFSYDVSERKLQALRRRAKSARLNSIQAVKVNEGSEAEQLKRFHGSADIVLVDAPCSGFGILRRSPDIKWKSSPEDFQKLPATQLRLLSVYSKLVRPGGRLIYGLCTFSKAESLEVVARFLADHPEFEAGSGGYHGPLPGGPDGFFMQSMTRKEEVTSP